jgi:hypothetical protein
MTPPAESINVGGPAARPATLVPAGTPCDCSAAPRLVVPPLGAVEITSFPSFSALAIDVGVSSALLGIILGILAFAYILAPDNHGILGH